MLDKRYQKLIDTNSALVIKGIYDGKLRVVERPKVVDADYAVVMKSYQETGGDVDALQNIMSTTYDAEKVCDAMLKFLQALRMADDKTRYGLSIETIADIWERNDIEFTPRGESYRLTGLNDKQRLHTALFWFQKCFNWINVHGG
jgi:hypothetical protein